MSIFCGLIYIATGSLDGQLNDDAKELRNAPSSPSHSLQEALVGVCLVRSGVKMLSGGHNEQTYLSQKLLHPLVLPVLLLRVGFVLRVLFGCLGSSQVPLSQLLRLEETTAFRVDWKAGNDQLDVCIHRCCDVERRRQARAHVRLSSASINTCLMLVRSGL